MDFVNIFFIYLHKIVQKIAAKMDLLSGIIHMFNSHHCLEEHGLEIWFKFIGFNLFIKF